MKKEAERQLLQYGALFAILLLLDILTKRYIVTNFYLGESRTAFPGLWFTYVQNTGTLWGLFQNANWIFIWISIIAFGLLLYFSDAFQARWERAAYTLILAGLFGNLIDRVSYGFVVDFIDLGWWPVFNIADSCIVVGIVLILLEQLRKR